MPSVPRWLAITWLAAGVTGLVAAVAIASFGSAFAASTTVAALDALEVTEDLLFTVGETAGAIDDTLLGVDEGMETVQRSVADAAVTLTQVGRVADDLGEVVTVTLPDSLDSLRDTMPQLIATAGVVDGAMRALRFVGVDYDPNQPLDDSLRELDAELAEIPSALREQAEAFEQASDGVSEFGGDALAIAGDIGAIQDRVASSREVVAGYTVVSENALGVIDGVRDRLAAQAAAARITVLVLGVAIAIGQTVPIAFGWWLLRSGRTAVAEPVDV